MKKLKIGDKLYRYSLHILEYKVYGIIKRDKGTMYEIECESCRDHEPCRILIADGGKHGYKFVDMLNNDGDDDTEQSYWHSEDRCEHSYYLTKNEAVIRKMESSLDYYKENAIKLEKNLENNNKRIAEIESQIEAIKDTSK